MEKAKLQEHQFNWQRPGLNSVYFLWVSCCSYPRHPAVPAEPLGTFAQGVCSAVLRGGLWVLQCLPRSIVSLLSHFYSKELFIFKATTSGTFLSPDPFAFLQCSGASAGTKACKCLF